MSNVTGEVCINVEYNGEYVPQGWDSHSCGQSAQTRGEDCGHSTPAYIKRAEENICVDVYDDNYIDATSRLDQLVEQKVNENSWQNVKYYCMYGFTRTWMSIFQSDSLAFSDKYCGKEPEVAEESWYEIGLKAHRESEAIFRNSCDRGDFAGCFNLANLHSKF